ALYLPFHSGTTIKRMPMNTTMIRLNASGSAICFRTLALLSMVILAATGIVYGQNGKLRPEETALRKLQWRAIGPAIMGGRIDDFGVVEGTSSTFYVGVATGGIWKNTNTD